MKHAISEAPIIVFGPGQYLTRSGLTVEIFEIKDPSKSSFFCHGHILKKNSRGAVRRKWSIWTDNGAHCGIGITDLDLVSQL